MLENYTAAWAYGADSESLCSPRRTVGPSLSCSRRWSLPAICPGGGEQGNSPSPRQASFLSSASDTNPTRCLQKLSKKGVSLSETTRKLPPRVLDALPGWNSSYGENKIAEQVGTLAVWPDCILSEHGHHHSSLCDFLSRATWPLCGG